MSLEEDILEFWFGPGGPESHTEQKLEWFKSTPELDAETLSRFGDACEQAATGQHDAMGDSANGSLALVILLDQFPRNMFRGTAQAFATDAKALSITKAAMSRGLDDELSTFGLMFLYMPFQHSEDIADQDRAVELFTKVEPDSATFAIAHRDVIAQFGRFPHRNAVLGRETTAEEATYLKNADTWGQG